MKILIAYFSWHGATDKVAARLRDDATAHDVSILRVKPKRERKYWCWLMLSFIPGSRVGINCDALEVGNYDLILLGSPKWTLSCPPFNQLLNCLKETRAKRVGFFMTYGGFDAKRYVEASLKRLSSMGMIPLSSLAVKREFTEGSKYLPLVDEFWQLVEKKVS